MAAADLSITATHSRGTLLKVEGTNTTVNPATLTLRVSNGGADPTAGVVTVADALPAGLTALINDAPSGAGPVAASRRGVDVRGDDVHALGRAGAGRLVPGHQGDGQDGQHRAGLGHQRADGLGRRRRGRRVGLGRDPDRHRRVRERVGGVGEGAVRAAGARDRLGRA